MAAYYINEHKTGQVAASAAEIYEQFFVPALFAQWPAHVLRVANVQSGDDILDVACGTGVLAREAANLVGNTGSVVGVDNNEGMLAVAQQRAPHVSWKTSPAESLPFADETFDCVVSQFGLMFFENQVKALTEMGRVLRPGGTMTVAVWESLDNTPGYAMVAELLDELFGPGVAASIQAPYSLGDRQSLTSLFADADMNDVTVQTITGKARFDSIESWIYTDIKGWTLANVIDDEGYELLKQRAPQKLSRFILADGSVSFDAPAHIVVWR